MFVTKMFASDDDFELAATRNRVPDQCNAATDDAGKLSANTGVVTTRLIATKVTKIAFRTCLSGAQLAE